MPNTSNLDYYNRSCHLYHVSAASSDKASAELWGCGNSGCSILLHPQICGNPKNFGNLNEISQQGAGKRPDPPPLMVR